jgi:hypothetical protein
MGDISRDEWELVYKMRGYSGEWINKLWRSKWKVLTDGDIMRVHEAGLSTPEQMAEQFKRFQYERQNISPLVISMEDRASRRASNRLTTSLLTAANEGLFSADELDPIWERLLYNKRARGYMRQNAELGQRRQTVRDSITRARRAVRSGVMGLDEFRVHITGLGLQEWKVNNIIELEETVEEGRIFTKATKRKSAEEKATITLLLRESLLAFRSGRIAENELRLNLEVIGLESALAEAYIRLAIEEMRETSPLPRAETAEQVRRRVKAFNVQEVEAAFRRGRISSADARANLIALGVHETEARARVSLMEAIAAEPDAVPKEAAQTVDEIAAERVERATAFERFRRDEIASSQLLAELVAAGTGAELAEAEVRREELKRAARRNVESEREAARAAKDKEKAAAVAAADIEREEEKLLAAIAREHEAATLDALRRELIAPQDAYINLLSLGLDPTLAEAKVDRAVVVSLDAQG